MEFIMNRYINISTYEGDNLILKNTTSALLEDNILIFHTDNDTIKINLKPFSFTKENNESILKISQNKCYLYLKDLNNTLELPLEELNYLIQDDLITITYKLASTANNIKIEITLGSEINELQN